MDAVVREARKEVAIEWRRPLVGPGARSQSADPRVYHNLEPLCRPPETRNVASPGPQTPCSPKTPRVSPPFRNGAVRREAWDTPSGGETFGIGDIQAASSNAAAESFAPSSAEETERHHELILLRPLRVAGQSVSTNGLADDAAADDLIDLVVESVPCEPRAVDREIPVFEGCQRRETFAAPHSISGASGTMEEFDLEMADSEMAEVEALLAERESLLIGTRVHEGELLSRLTASESLVARLNETVIRLEAGLKEAIDDANAVAPNVRHHAPRCKTAASPVPSEIVQESVISARTWTTVPLEGLVDQWSRAKTALGL